MGWLQRHFPGTAPPSGTAPRGPGNVHLPTSDPAKAEIVRLYLLGGERALPADLV